MNGSVIPVIGNKPKVILIFWNCWYIIIPIIPINIYLSSKFIFFFIRLISVKSNKAIISNRKIEPMKPNIELYVVKIKSVLDSGKYNGKLFIPYPTKPLDAITIKEFSNW